VISDGVRTVRVLTGVVALALLGAALAACRASREGGGRDAAAKLEAPPPPVDAAIDAPPGATWVVPRLKLQPGTRSTVTFEAHIDFDLDIGGYQTKTVTDQRKRKTMEILAVDPDGAVHRRVTYQDLETDIRMDGRPYKDPDATPLAGKSFRTTWKDGVLDVRRASGKAATPAEIEAVRKEEGQMQSPEYFSTHLGGVRLVEGVPYDLPLAAFAEFMSGEYRPRRVVITYRGATDGVHKLEAEVSLLGAGESMETYVDLDAEALFDDTGWCLEVRVDAQVRAEIGGTVMGSGAGTGVVKATPLQAAAP
jgi:hypothetical protein